MLESRPVPATPRTQEAIVLAGGLGTRLAGAIGALPKPMAPVAGRPFLEWQLEALERRGIRAAILSVGHRREAIEAHFGPRYRGLSIRYAREESPLGTGGAIVAAMEHVRGPAAFVLNGDTYIRAPLAALESLPCELAILVARVHDAARFGTVEVSGGRVVGFREKSAGGPGLVNSGVYWIAKALVARMPKVAAFSFERDFMEPSAPRLAIGAVITDEPMVDIGIPESLAGAEAIVPRLAAADAAPG
jgi:D-glycero-alpha-D-manno-heptose 1-phosphate guanylyltransferase